MKNLIFGLILILGISCTNDSIVQPTKPYVYASDSDQLIVKMKASLIGNWNVISTNSTYPIPEGGQLFVIFGTVDCSKERQWDYVQSLSIASYDSHLLMVQNIYYCTTQRVTYFEFFKEKNSDRMYITEEDEKGYMIKIYRIDPTNDPSEIYLFSNIFDFSYFKFNNVGSIKAAPFDYVIHIKKGA